MRRARPILPRRGEAIGEAVFHQRFDFALAFVGELQPVAAEQLDAVVVIGVVGGRDHHAEIGAQRARQHGDGGRRQRAEQEHVHAHGGEAGDERGFDHVAGEARVLADHHAVAMIAMGEDAAGGHAHFEGDLRRHGETVRESPDAVGPEQVALHVPSQVQGFEPSGILMVKSIIERYAQQPRFWRLSLMLARQYGTKRLTRREAAWVRGCGSCRRRGARNAVRPRASPGRCP